MPNNTPAQRKSGSTPLSVLAASQHGVVTYRQLRALGVSESAISRRRDLHRLFPGVYAVGHTALSREGRWLAAVLAAGDGAVLSHESLAALFGLQRWAPREPDVLVPRRHRPIPGVNLRETRTLDPLDVTVFKGIPVTTIPRLFIDLSDSLIAEELTHLIHEAAYLGLLDLKAVRRAMARANGRHNLDVLEQAIEDWLAGSAGTRSRGEVAFRRAIADLGLPRPLTNMKVCGHEVDFHWPDRKLVVEIDGPNHLRPPTRSTDVTRDIDLTAAEWTILRCKTYEIAIAKLRTEVDRNLP